MTDNRKARGGQPSGLDNQNDIRPDVDTATNTASQEPFTSPYGVALLQFDWGHPNELQTEWLVSQGVRLDALLKPWPIGATRVRFEDGYFIPDETGERVITIVCFDRGVPIDIAAWQPKTNQIATYFGRAAFLGDEDDCFNPATWFAGSDLRICATPLEWLQANREGVVIVDERRAGDILRNVRSVSCADDQTAATVHRWLMPAEPLTKIFVSVPRRIVA